VKFMVLAIANLQNSCLSQQITSKKSQINRIR
jgi:hypothetical protein